MVGRLLFRRKKRNEEAAAAPSTLPTEGPPQALEEVQQAGDEQRKTDRWWRGSSFELRHGLEVQEMETVPSEVFDELFGDTDWGKDGKRQR